IRDFHVTGVQTCALPIYGTEYRSASGMPGPKYWQNAVDYKISAQLNDQTNEITATVTLEYTNNSPDELDFIWLQLDQNMFSQEEIGRASCRERVEVAVDR